MGQNQYFSRYVKVDDNYRCSIIRLWKHFQLMYMKKLR